MAKWQRSPRFGLWFWLCIATLTVSSPVFAGPPYMTDDPEPTDTGHWEDYLFVLGTHFPSETTGQLGFEFNYGAAPDLQLSVTAPLNYDEPNGYRFGSGDIQLGAKYRFLHQSEDSWMPDVSVYPSLSLPTASRIFGVQQPSLYLPIWMQKDFGKWSTFGGVGYDINPGRGNRNFQFVGWAVTRSVTERLNIGVEIYHQTAATVGGTALTNLGIGVIYQLTKHFALMASGGPGFEKPSQSGQASFYASVQLTY
jgi:hypothetical protein